MKFKNESKFRISGLNQEKVLNELSKEVSLFEIDRHAKNDTTFKCGFFEHKKVLKILKNKGVKIEQVQHEGIFYRIIKSLSAYGLIAAMLLFSFFYFFQSDFVVQYDVQGVENLSKTEIANFVKENFSAKKSQLSTENIEVELTKNFVEISFVSCMIKGQTLVINIKEKLLPDQIYGEFAPIVATKDGKITSIALVSGTLCVKVGDIVQAGDVLVQPYTIDTTGQLKKVQAVAEIMAEVYYEESVDHFESYVEVKRTGRVAMKNEITLFGLKVYNFNEENDFKMFEVETEEVGIVRNLFLPFKMTKTYIYELEEKTIESVFEDVKDEFIEKAKQKVLENCENYDRMIDEFYTIRHFAGVTIVKYCVVTEECVSLQEKK